MIANDGEVPKATIVKADSYSEEENDEDVVKNMESRHKRLKGGVDFVSVMPKTRSGKILRPFLRDKECGRLNLMQSFGRSIQSNRETYSPRILVLEIGHYSLDAVVLTRPLSSILYSRPSFHPAQDSKSA